eukprot:7502761-Karenia_brevis.AAC.1
MVRTCMSSSMIGMNLDMHSCSVVESGHAAMHHSLFGHEFLIKPHSLTHEQKMIASHGKAMIPG